MRRLILSTPLLQDFGCYDYFSMSLEEARAWMYQGPYFVAMRSRDLCYALHSLVGRNIFPLSGLETPTLRPGDEALVFYVPLSAEVRSARELTSDYILQNYRLGLLKHVEVSETSQHTTDELDGIAPIEQELVAAKGEAL